MEEAALEEHDPLTHTVTLSFHSVIYLWIPGLEAAGTPILHPHTSPP